MDDLKKKRKASNKELLEILTELVEKTNGELRFSQLLAGYGFVSDAFAFSYKERPDKYWNNEFNTEPKVVLDRVKKITEVRKV